MRIYIGITMTREVFGTSHHPMILHPFHILVTFGRYIVSVFSKRTGIDNWISGIIIYIDYRREIDVNPYSFHLTSYFFTHVINELIVLNSPQHELSRITNSRCFHAHS